jgi:phage terminase large subunit-like protein
LKSIKSIANEHGLRIKKVIYDSSYLQIAQSKLLEKGIPLCKQKLKDHFSRKQIKQFKKIAKDLNLKQQGDQAMIILEKNNQQHF